jgi:SAM-dependent methyltransferase
MATAGTPDDAQAAAADRGQRRWAEMLTSLAALLPPGAGCVLVDGPAEQARLFASRLSADLAARGLPVQVTVPADRASGGGVSADGIGGDGARAHGSSADGAADATIFLRTAPGGHRGVLRGHEDPRGHEDSGHEDPCGREDRQPGEQTALDRGGREHGADIVIDLHDVQWPVIRRVAPRLAARGPWYLTETRAFFACRAATWNTKFGDDLPAYRAAVAEAGIRRDGVAIDIGCGTGRALPPLRAAVGPAGTVIAVDITPEMLHAARPASAVARAALVLADARALPVADGSADAIFAAGLVNHLPDTEAGLRELARVTRPGGLLVLFHPSGRAALAARHGHSVSHDEPLAEGPLRRSTAASRWRLTAYDDAPHRFFAVAERR